MGTSSSTLNAEAINQLSWFSRNNKHRLKLTQRAASRELRSGPDDQRARHVHLQLAGRPRGEPAGVVHARSCSRACRAPASSSARCRSATRTGAAPTSRSSTASGSTATASRRRRSSTRSCEHAFGVRNDRAPNRLYVSPRIGFSWNYGTAPQIAGFDGAVRGPRAVVRGGVGVFQSTPERQLDRHRDRQHRARRAPCSRSPASARRCRSPTGRRTRTNPACDPDPVRRRHARAACSPTRRRTSRCSPRTSSAPRSVRSQPELERPDPRQPVQRERRSSPTRSTSTRRSTLDLNFQPAQRFALADEAGRPVFVQPGSIVPATGAIASRDARVSPLFNRVSQLRSDLRSESKQLRARALPRHVHAALHLVAQLHAGRRARAVPRLPEHGRAIRSTSPGRAPRASRAIRSSYTLGYNFFDAVRVNWFGQFRSGAPFTPDHRGRRQRRRLDERPRVRVRSRAARAIRRWRARCVRSSRRDRARARDCLAQAARRRSRRATRAAGRGRRTRTSASRSTR